MFFWRPPHRALTPQGWDDLAQGNFVKQGATSPTTPYVWMAANCLATAMYALFMKSKIKLVGFRDYDTVYFNNLLSLPILLILSLLTEGAELQSTMQRYSVGGESEGQFGGLLLAICLSGVTTFGISYCSSWCVRTTSSTTFRQVARPPNLCQIVWWDH